MAKRKLLVTLLSVLLVMCFAFGLVACGNTETSGSTECKHTAYGEWFITEPAQGGKDGKDGKKAKKCKECDKIEEEVLTYYDMVGMGYKVVVDESLLLKNCTVDMTVMAGDETVATTKIQINGDKVRVKPGKGNSSYKDGDEGKQEIDAIMKSIFGNLQNVDYSKFNYDKNEDMFTATDVSIEDEASGFTYTKISAQFTVGHNNDKFNGKITYLELYAEKDGVAHKIIFSISGHGKTEVVKCEHVADLLGDWEVVTEPTCTETGLKKAVCACGDEVTEDIAALEHDMGEWEVVKPATIDEEGEEKKACKRENCSYSETQKIAKVEIADDFFMNLVESLFSNQYAVVANANVDGTSDEEEVLFGYTEEYGYYFYVSMVMADMDTKLMLKDKIVYQQTMGKNHLNQDINNFTVAPLNQFIGLNIPNDELFAVLDVLRVDGVEIIQDLLESNNEQISASVKQTILDFCNVTPIESGYLITLDFDKVIEFVLSFGTKTVAELLGVDAMAFIDDLPDLTMGEVIDFIFDSENGIDFVKFVDMANKVLAAMPSVVGPEVTIDMLLAGILGDAFDIDPQTFNLYNLLFTADSSLRSITVADIMSMTFGMPKAMMNLWKDNIILAMENANVYELIQYISEGCDGYNVQNAKENQAATEEAILGLKNAIVVGITTDSFGKITKVDQALEPEYFETFTGIFGDTGTEMKAEMSFLFAYETDYSYDSLATTINSKFNLIKTIGGSFTDYNPDDDYDYTWATDDNDNVIGITVRYSRTYYELIDSYDEIEIFSVEDATETYTFYFNDINMSYSPDNDHEAHMTEYKTIILEGNVWVEVEGEAYQITIDHSNNVPAESPREPISYVQSEYKTIYLVHGEDRNSQWWDVDDSVSVCTYHEKENKRIEPTCTVEGKAYYECSCGKQYVENLGYAHDYQYETKLVEGATTCEDGVIQIVTCSNCDYEYVSGIMYDVYGGEERRVFEGEDFELYVYMCVCGHKVVDVGGSVYEMGSYEDGEYFTTIYGIEGSNRIIIRQSGVSVVSNGGKDMLQSVDTFTLMEGDQTIKIETIHGTMYEIVDNGCSHDDMDLRYIYLGEEGNCFDGVKTEIYCKDCEELLAVKFSKQHASISLLETIYLEMVGSTESSYILVNNMPCGACEDSKRYYYIGSAEGRVVQSANIEVEGVIYPTDFSLINATAIEYVQEDGFRFLITYGDQMPLGLAVYDEDLQAYTSSYMNNLI